MSSLSSKPYKGTRDYYPEDKRVQNYIFSTWKKVVESFGYEEYGAPMLEPLEVYAAKSGQELANEQTYAFTDRGDRQVAIRPEMTPSISRMIADRRQELAYPARLYSIANFMRYERPQRGREREFWQLNADIFGADGPAAEAEIIQIGAEIMKRFGATNDMFRIRVNNRRLINAVMHDYLGLDEVQSQLMIKLFDRRDKIGTEEFRDQAIDIFGAEKAPDGLKKVSSLLLGKTLDKLPSELVDNENLEEVKQLFALLGAAGIDNADFDITLMRGLDYYTGTVFEFFDTDPENSRSLFGGGRYDGLVGLFGAESISAVGFAPGLTMTELFLRSHDLLPKLSTATEAYVVVFDGAETGAAALAHELRAEGVRTELDVSGRKFDRQLKTAIKKGVPFLVFVGPDDLKAERYNFKDTKSGEEQKLSVERIISAVKDRRRHTSDEFDELLDV